MIPETDLRAILEDAVRAPSGDNVQPWRFRKKSEALEVLNDPTADRSLYNVEQAASLMSIGALLCNLEIAALAVGYTVSQELFPDGKEPDLVARVLFTKATPYTSALSSALRERCTNRSRYDGVSLSEGERAIFSNHGPIDVQLVEASAKDEVGKAAAMNEKIVLEDRAMHDFLFGHVTWSAQEDSTRPGFFVDTLGLNPVQRSVFKLYKNWNIASILNRFGFSRLVVRDNASMYTSASAAFALLVDTPDRTSFVRVGMALQDVWLRATVAKLSIQPLAGIPLLALSIRRGGADILSGAHRAVANDAYASMERAFGAKGKHILFAARVGHAQPPVARTRRREITIE